MLHLGLVLLATAAADKHDGLGMAIGEAADSLRPVPPPPPPNPALVKLEQKYNATRTAACAEVLSHAPTLDATTAAAFM